MSLIDFGVMASAMRVGMTASKARMILLAFPVTTTGLLRSHPRQPSVTTLSADSHIQRGIWEAMSGIPSRA